ncbi:SRPBCC family protein [Humitalea sp. 24SJ18S-53]|uniref:SRPBCC family protein n=1 Tax=Humitalea sp. 24SJ18S-53 TaxID=3422307 RepID=UPI003D66DA38
MTTVIPSVTLVRRLRAPPSRVFAAWTDAATLATWFGPHHTRAEEAEVDAQPGGHFRVALREDNGARHEVAGTYTEVTPDTALVFTWAWTNAPERQSRVTIRLRAVPEGTELTLVHDRFADADTATRHVRGWTESFERLVALFEGTPA